MVRPGGFVLIVHFANVAGVVYEHPKNPDKLVKRHELSEAFTEMGFDVVHDRVDECNDGRFLNNFLARRRINE
eukprot:1194724-Prorocentrum_minimum.AAC.1